MKPLRFLAAAVTAGLVIAGIAACGSSRFDEAKENVEKTGTANVALTATANGSTYRLELARFDITGRQTMSLFSDTDINAVDIQQTLIEGDYEIYLNGGWKLERLDDAGPTQVNASLVSAARQSFHINTGQTTIITYEFSVDGAPLVFGTGTLDLGVKVTPCPDGQGSCGSGCVDLQSNGSHCGACNIVCGMNEYCQWGECHTCTQGVQPALCNGACTDLSNDPANCGACGVICAPGSNCIMFGCYP